jgi:hypothetical protein
MSFRSSTENEIRSSRSPRRKDANFGKETFDKSFRAFARDIPNPIFVPFVLFVVKAPASDSLIIQRDHMG